MASGRVFKRFLALLITLTIAAPLSANAQELSEYGFDAGRYLTREECCAVIAGELMPGKSGGSLPFADKSRISPEYEGALGALYEGGYLAGKEENGELFMHPREAISRAEAFTFLGRVLGKTSDMRPDYTDTGAIAGYALEYVGWFKTHRIAAGYPDGSFKPEKGITAGELMSLITRLLEFEERNSVSVETRIGTGMGGFLNGGAQIARFLQPNGLLFNDDNLVIFDTYNNMIREMKAASANTLTGSKGALGDDRLPEGGYTDGELKKALLNRPTGGAVIDGKLYFCDSANNAIRYIEDGEVKTLAGGAAGFADGKGEGAKLNCPVSIAADADGSLYIADSINNCIRRVDAEGNVTTIAGSPKKEGYTDGEAASALFRQPSGIAVLNGVIYISDTGNHLIRKIENGTVSTVAGSISQRDEDGAPLGGFEDGKAETASFCLPYGIAISDGVIIVADSGNNAVRAINKAGIVTTVLGCGEPGDVSGNALEAQLNNPLGVCFYGGSLYIADTNNNKIKALPFNAGLY